MISVTGNRNFLMKTLLSVSIILILSGSASASDLCFEGYTSDLPNSVFYNVGGCSILASDNGNAIKAVSGSSNVFNITMAIDNYIGFTTYSFCDGSHPNVVSLNYYDSQNRIVASIQGALYIYPTPWGSYWRRYEFIENDAGSGLDVYVNGIKYLSTPYLITNPVPTIQKVQIALNAVGGTGDNYFDDFTTSSSRSVIGMDDLVTVGDLGQYYRIGGRFLETGKYYQTRLYSPDNQLVYVQNFTNDTLLNEKLIPSSIVNEIGDYTLHLYRVDSGGSKVFLSMKSFECVDYAATNEGTITIDKTDYESGESVKFYTILNEYSPGYKVVCEFPASGANFKKTVDITSESFQGSFTIPDISNVMGAHTVYLIDPNGKVVDSADFNVYVPGLPDIAFDKAEYERTDKALIYYKDVSPDSTISVYMRYGGTTSQTLVYDVSGSGVVSIDLSTMSACDSMLAVVKDSDGYKNDDDNAKVIVGNYELSGRTYDAKTGSVIPGATVTLQGKSVNSDANGNYNITALAGFANYTVAANGYNSITGTVAVFDLKTLHNFYLSPTINNGGTGVYGTVVSSKTDYPLVGASVEVTNTDSLKRFSTIVDNKGFYSLSNNDLAGNLSIKVSYNNYDSIVATAAVTSGSMQNHNFRLNAVPGYEEIDPSEHSGGQDSANPDETAEEKAYREKFGEMGQHPFDFNSDGTVENSEWRYAGERLIMLIGIMAFMGFLMMINRRR